MAGLGITHISIVVRDLQKTMESYWELLGIGPWAIFNVRPPELKATFKGQPAHYSIKTAFAQLDDGSVLELVQPLDGQSVYQEFLDKRGEGVHHIQLGCADASGLEASLSGKGIAPFADFDWNGLLFTYLNTEKPLGLVMELVHERPGYTTAMPDAIYPPVANGV